MHALCAIVRRQETPACRAIDARSAARLVIDGPRISTIVSTQVWPQTTELRRLAQELDLGDRLQVDKLDVLDAGDVKKALAWDFDTFVSNAAIGESGPIAEIPVELVRRTFETNVRRLPQYRKRSAKRVVATRAQQYACS